jgi:hypothetical protein
MHITCLSKNMKGRDHTEDVSVDVKIIRKDLREISCEGVDWHQSWDRDQWLAVVNTLITFWFHKRQGVS